MVEVLKATQSGAAGFTGDLCQTSDTDTRMVGYDS
jgi:hypothetical protein